MRWSMEMRRDNHREVVRVTGVSLRAKREKISLLPRTAPTLQLINSALFWFNNLHGTVFNISR